MKLSTKSQYGLRAMLHLAAHYNDGAIAAKDISRSEGISITYLEQILTKLRRAGLVKSERGPKGGYILTRPPKRITALDIVRVLEEKLEPVFCVSTSKGISKKICGRESTCAARVIWEKLSKSIARTLGSVTLEYLCRKTGKGLKGKAPVKRLSLSI